MVLGQEFNYRVCLKTWWLKLTTWWQKRTKIIKTAKKGKSHQKIFKKVISDKNVQRLFWRREFEGEMLFLEIIRRSSWSAASSLGINLFENMEKDYQEMTQTECSSLLYILSLSKIPSVPGIVAFINKQIKPLFFSLLWLWLNSFSW